MTLRNGVVSSPIPDQVAVLRLAKPPAVMAAKQTKLQPPPADRYSMVLKKINEEQGVVKQIGRQPETSSPGAGQLSLCTALRLCFFDLG